MILLLILVFTLFLQADSNAFLDALHKSYNNKVQGNKGFQFVKTTNEPIQKKVQEEFLRLLPLYLAEQNPFHEEVKGDTPYVDILQFMRILVAYNKTIIATKKSNLIHKHTLKGLKTFMSQDNNLLAYFVSLDLYKSYLSSMSCQDRHTKEILTQNYPLSPEKTYLKVVQKEEDEMLSLSSKALLSDLNLSLEQNTLLSKQVMNHLKAGS
jgi:hypothetical protein